MEQHGRNKKRLGPRKHLARVAVAFTAAALIAAAAACGRKDDPYGGSVVIASLTVPEGLNPLVYRDSVSNNVGSLVFNKLIWLNERAEPEGDLAESWEVSEDSLAWTFHIREGVHFHDGVELTAEDCAFTFNAARDPSSGSPMAPLFGVVKDVAATGRYELEIRLHEPYAPLIYLLLMEIVPAHHFRENGTADPEFNEHPVGTGPFRFVEWREDEIVLEAHEEYFDGRPYLDEVVLKFFPDKRRAWSELMRGNVDVVPDLDLEDYEVIENDDRFSVYDYLEVFYYTLLFNLKDPLLGDPVMRKAIDLAIDRQDLIDNGLQGWGVPTTGPYRPGTWPYNPDVPEAEYDPGKTSQLLESLGWRDEDEDLILEKNGTELTLSLLADSGDLLKEAVAQRIKWQLFKVGIRVEMQFLDLQRLFQERLMPGEFQGVLLQFNSSGDPDKFTYLFWHSSQIGRSNLGFYSSEEVDRLIETGAIESDHSERVGIYRRIHEMIARDRPAVFLFYRMNFLGASSNVLVAAAEPSVYYRSIKDWKLIEKP